MKEIKAIIQPFMFDKVVEALAEIPGFPGMTVSDIRGFGRQMGGRPEGAEAPFAFVPKVKLEVVVPDDLVNAVVTTIADTARTGRVGDGKIFVLPVLMARRIRTGHEDEEAI